MNKDEYPINLIYDGIADLLSVHGETINIIGSSADVWITKTIEYGGYLYTIVSRFGVIVDINRIEKRKGGKL